MLCQQVHFFLPALPLPLAQGGSGGTGGQLVYTTCLLHPTSKMCHTQLSKAFLLAQLAGA